MIVLETIDFSAKSLTSGYVLLAGHTAATARLVTARVRFDALAGASEYALQRRVYDGSSERPIPEEYFYLASAGAMMCQPAATYLAAGETLRIYARAYNATDTSEAGRVEFVDGLADVALEASVQTIDGVVDTIVAKTNLIPASPASETTLEGVADEVDSIAAIATATRDAAVSADGKLPEGLPAILANLDVAVSTRSSHSPADVEAALAAAHGSGEWTTATGFATPEDLAEIPGGGCIGDGDIDVNHDSGGIDNLRILGSGGIGIDNASIRAYYKEDWDAGLKNVIARTSTGSDGRWIAPMRLDPGTYVLTISKPGLPASEVEITVTA